MSFSTSKPVACRIAPVSGPNGLHSKVSKVKMVNGKALPPLQVKEKEKLVLQESSTTASRREIMHLTAASIGLLSLLVPGVAEARTKNASIRQKIMEKFEELRQKAGLSKPKEEAQEKKPKEEDQEKKPKTEAEEKKPIPEAEAKKPKDEAEAKKLKNEGEEKKPKAEEKKPKDLKNDGEEKKHATSSQQSTAPKDEVPALPSILNDKIVETNLP